MSALRSSLKLTRSAAAAQACQTYPKTPPKLIEKVENNPPIRLSAEHDLPMGSWSEDQIKDAVKDSVMLTWAPGNARYGLPLLRRGEGVYLYDDQGKRYLDWTSQAVCSNLGYTLPDSIVQGTMNQMQELPFVYGGLGVTEIRARLSKLMKEVLPGDLNGMVFPSSGGEANEAAITMARRHTGKLKVMNFHRSYHGGTANARQSTGDIRRWCGGDTIPGFVKVFNPFPLYYDIGRPDATEEDVAEAALCMLEEQILYENPDNIAMISFESIVGSGGVIIPPKGYMQGVRALCDKYDILLHCDEVMVGFGRTGQMFGFQNFEGVLPDIVTCAKGLSSSAIPISMAICRQHVMDSFEDQALGWGSTYQAHPTAMACAYETVKYLIRENIVGKVQTLAPTFERGMQRLMEHHPCIKQYRHIGMFGCFDIQMPDGTLPPANLFGTYKEAFAKNGLIGMIRPPHLHVAPPLIINEEELLDGFERNDQALYALDKALGF